MDSNWILQVLMETEEQDAGVKQEIEGLFQMIRDRQLDAATDKVRFLRGKIGNSEALQRAVSTMERMRMLGK